MLKYIRESYQTSRNQVPKEYNVFEIQTSEIFEISDRIERMKEVIQKTDELLAQTVYKNEFLTTLSFPHDDEDAILSSESHMKRLFWPYLLTKPVTRVEDIINRIRMHGFDAIAERLTLLHEMIGKEQDEKPIVLSSLQNFTRFIVSKPQLSNPRIGINPNGLLQAVWRIPNYGTLAMNFLTSSDVVFTIVFSQQDSASPRRKISGVMSSHKMMYHIKEFVDKLAV